MKRPHVDRGRVNDPREGYVIAGVSNRDARSVYDVRVAAMRTLWAAGEASPESLVTLRGLLHDAQRLTLWRARRLTDFAAFVEDVLGMPSARALELVQEHSFESRESDAALNERDVAVWLRTEAGLYEGDEAARVRLRNITGAGVTLELSISLQNASAGLSGAGVRHAPLARERAEAQANERPSHGGDRHERVAPAPQPEPQDDRDAANLERINDAPEPVLLGGARLLKRKVQAPAAPADELGVLGDADGADSEDDVDVEAPAPREHRPAQEGLRSALRDASAAPRRPSEREPSRAFDRREAGDRPPRREGGDANRAREHRAPEGRGGFGGARPPRGGGKPGFGDKPAFNRGGDRPAFNRGGERPAFNRGGDKPTFERGDRPAFDRGGERPAFNRGGDRPGGRAGGFAAKPGNGDRPAGKFGGKPAGGFGGKPGAKFGPKPGGFGGKPGGFGAKPGGFGGKPGGGFGGKPGGGFGAKPGGFGAKAGGKFGGKGAFNPAGAKPAGFTKRPGGKYGGRERRRDDE